MKKIKDQTSPPDFKLAIALLNRLAQDDNGIAILDDQMRYRVWNAAYREKLSQDVQMQLKPMANHLVIHKSITIKKEKLDMYYECLEKGKSYDIPDVFRGKPLTWCLKAIPMGEVNWMEICVKEVSNG